MWGTYVEPAERRANTQSAHRKKNFSFLAAAAAFFHRSPFFTRCVLVWNIIFPFVQHFSLFTERTEGVPIDTAVVEQERRGRKEEKRKVKTLVKLSIRRTIMLMLWSPRLGGVLCFCLCKLSPNRRKYRTHKHTHTQHDECETLASVFFLRESRTMKMRLAQERSVKFFCTTR